MLAELRAAGQVRQQLLEFAQYGRPASSTCWVRRSLDAATISIARVILPMFLTERRRRRRVLSDSTIAYPAFFAVNVALNSLIAWFRPASVFFAEQAGLVQVQVDLGVFLVDERVEPALEFGQRLPAAGRPARRGSPRR